MKELTLKSKGLKIDDYKSIDIMEQLPEFLVDVDILDKNIKRYQYANGIKKDVNQIEKGDLINLSCKSNHPRFNKENIYVVVGKNLWDETFEEKLIGCEKGFSTIHFNDISVLVNIHHIERTLIPELNDENVKNWNIENIHSVEDLKKYCFKRQILSFYEDVEEAEFVTSHLYLKFLESCEFDLDEDEIKAVRKTVNHQIKEAKMLREQMIENGQIDPNDGWDMVILAEDMVFQTLKSAVCGYAHLKEINQIPTEENYLNAIYKRKAYSNLSIEELKEIYTETDFLIEECSCYFFDEMEAYVKELMTNVYYERNQKRIAGYDVAIIGSGPAGLSAALTLNIHNKNIVWFGSKDLSDKVEKSEMIVNYAGFDAITGKELNQQFKHQIEKNHLEITEKMVTQITKTKDGFIVLANNSIYKVKTVLLAMGAVTSKGIENEQRLLGHGVSYCATCDGFLYENKSISVFVSHPRYEHEVEYLADIADKVYYYAPFESQIDLPNVIHLEKPIKKVIGENKVEGIECTNGEVILVDGAFFIRDAIAPTTILKDLEMEGAHIVINRQTETNIEGCFAAGDCTGRPYQLAKAIGEGNVAAHRIVEYLSKK